LEISGILWSRFNETANIEYERVRIGELKKLLEKLPEIRFNTLREIVRHLHFIQTQSSVNKMSTKNLAIAWGKSLLGDMDLRQREASIVSDMIVHTKVLFNLQDSDLVISFLYN
jgi:RhoGAP domain